MQTLILTALNTLLTAQQANARRVVLHVGEGVKAAYWYLASFYFGYFNQMPNHQ